MNSRMSRQDNADGNNNNNNNHHTPQQESFWTWVFGPRLAETGDYGYQPVPSAAEDDHRPPAQDPDQDPDFAHYYQDDVDQDQDQGESSSQARASMDLPEVVGVDHASKEVHVTSTLHLTPSGSEEHDGSERPAAAAEDAAVRHGIQLLKAQEVHWWSYFTTADFWIVVAIGQVLSLCITGTNTFTSLLANFGTNIPAFQTLFNYVLLFLVYTTITLVRDGPRVWLRIAVEDGWKYLILSFMDVEGNYFTVLAYNYTNILSAQLLNFWSIVCVVIISFLLLKVRYKPFQMLGILVCCGGMGILLASDHITGANGGPGKNMLKGDLFGLLGATLYGTSNVFEEWFVSKRPMHHVLSFMGLFGILINGAQAGIFDRHSFEGATWDGRVAGWLVGYTLCLFVFYTLAPLILRMGSAAFFDISLLTANFWGVIIGIHLFHDKVHYLYPIAFALILVGLLVYFLSGSVLGDARKPWLGENQEGGVAGFGTAKLRAINEARKAGGVSGTEAAVVTVA